jgi:hypothetical protein
MLLVDGNRPSTTGRRSVTLRTTRPGARRVASPPRDAPPPRLRGPPTAPPPRWRGSTRAIPPPRRHDPTMSLLCAGAGPCAATPPRRRRPSSAPTQSRRRPSSASTRPCVLLFLHSSATPHLPCFFLPSREKTGGHPMKRPLIRGD